MKRALRRHHRERLKAKRKNYWWWGVKDPRYLGILVNTPCPCSCAGCTNPRNLKGRDYRSRQEKAMDFYQKIEEQEDERL